jgi:hypothetical protein
MRRTKAAQIYKKTGNRKPKSRAVVAGAHEARNTVRYLGIEVDDALTISEQVEI